MTAVPSCAGDNQVLRLLEQTELEISSLPKIAGELLARLSTIESVRDQGEINEICQQFFSTLTKIEASLRVCEVATPAPTPFTMNANAEIGLMDIDRACARQIIHGLRTIADALEKLQQSSVSSATPQSNTSASASAMDAFGYSE